MASGHNYSQLRLALRAWLAGGTIGVAVDADHVPAILGVCTTPPLNVLGLEPGRCLHSAIFLVGCAIIACTTGLVAATILRR